MVRIPYMNDFETVDIYGTGYTIHGNLMDRNKVFQWYILNDLEFQKYHLLATASSTTDQNWEALTYSNDVVDVKGDNVDFTSQWS